MPYINMNLPQVYTCSPSWTPLPPPSPYHPSGSSQCTSPKHPVSCIEPGLATHFIYDIIHISMPFSQIIPPSPSPTEPKRLFLLWLLWPKLPKLCWMVVVRVGTLVLFLTLRKHFQFFTSKDNVYCRFVLYGFYYVEVCSFYACFLGGFYHK